MRREATGRRERKEGTGKGRVKGGEGEHVSASSG